MLHKVLRHFKKVNNRQDKGAEEAFNQRTVASLSVEDSLKEAKNLDRTNKIADIIISELGLSSKDKILDMGCYNGLYEIMLAKRGIGNIIGVDISKDAVNLANKVKVRLKLKANFQVADAEQLPFKDNEFDAVLMLGLLHHLPDKSTITALKEAKRVLKPNGRILIADPNLYHPRIVYAHLLLNSSDNELAYTFMELRGIIRTFFKIKNAYTLRYLPRSEVLDGFLHNVPLVNRLGAETIISAYLEDSDDNKQRPD
jgi:ubiquinone/menaquinone biosynthesis C-methylase UbiE